jgi:ubiquinone/menaquinone biosynthesis C-methylase UbiE
MRIKTQGDNMMERAALAAGLVPEPLVLSFFGMGVCRCLVTALSVGVFEALEPGAKTADEMADELECDPTGMETLLNALNGFGYLRRRHGRYSLAGDSKKWLVESSRFSLAEVLPFFQDVWDQLGFLEDAVRKGEMRNFHQSGLTDQAWKRYVRALGAFARMAAPVAVRKIKPERPPRKLLDVGGGHGLFAAAFVKKYPGLEARVLDLPAACAHGRKIIEDEGLAGRVKFIEGDLRTGKLGEDYDLVLVFNVIHNCTPQEAGSLIRRAFDALAPGGLLAVMDAEHKGGGGDLGAVAGFNELFFFLLSGTRAYPEESIRGWMGEAGFVDVRRASLMMLPEVLLTGKRQGPARG